MSESPLISPLNQVPTDVLTAPGNGLENRVRAAQSASGDKQKSELKKVAQEFESIFIAHMLKVMRETINESGLLEGGFGKSIYTDLFDEQVSLSMARHGALGISDLLYQNLSRVVDSNAKESDPTPAKAPAPALQTPAQASPKGSGASSNEPERAISDLQLPVQGPVSSAFGMRTDPFSRQARFHRGLDLAAPQGMKVMAALPGTVISAGYESGYGNTVLMQHAGGVQTRYGHLGSITVKAGDVVASQGILGTVGDTGKTTGPHLHFEVIRMGQPVNPILTFSSHTAVSEQDSGSQKTGG